MGKDRLKIAIVAPPWLSTYPGCFYGIENVIHYLTATLTELGHHVELFTLGNTTTPATKRHWLYKENQYQHIHRPYYETASIVVSHIAHAANIIREAGDFDIIHDHNSYFGPAMWGMVGDNMPPVLHTLHEPFTDNQLLTSGVPDNRMMYAQLASSKRLFFNGVSKAQIESAPAEMRSRIKGVIYNGIALEERPFRVKKENYFLNVGRIAPDKGQGTAARLCAELGEDFKMAGTIGASIDTPEKLAAELADPGGAARNGPYFKYFVKHVLPHMKPKHIEYLGTILGEKRYILFAKAKGFLSPLNRDEPFGMVTIDALAAGTPVVAYPRGATPEIIEHGVNGFLANDENEFREYMKRVHEIDPAACRKTVAERFSAKAMTQNYVQLYRKIIAEAS